ncbi:CARDB domain-containing protein [Candidatus Uabimicrobium amorphum]|uniref:CARDB domain-containing protein n=1 Tax=Uabimicrobium amorphum TaxID=2596890 RepID=A0A5S9IL61_UABAM|nr:CARDB domain-containing protein [Candidatus Uabimicrobium amorphum]BBM83381.1 hypothetical protein UABAM_01733 [Candidatus Uabimicrobium amorphum]
MKKIVFFVIVLLSGQLFCDGITITKPNAGVVKYGSMLQIQWTKTGEMANTVYIALMRGNSVIRTIASSAPNNGTYNWRVAAHDGKYFIRISVLANANYPNPVRATSREFYVRGLNADLAINWLKVSPKRKHVQQHLTFTASIYNAGVQKAKATTALLEIKGPTGKQNVWLPCGELPGGMTNTITYKYKLSQYGIYRNTFTLDAKKQLYSPNPAMGEKQVNNNKKFIVYGISPLPDLIIIARKYQHVKVPGKGTVVVKVKNIGDTSSAKTQLKFAIQKKKTKYFSIPVLKPKQIYIVKRREHWVMPGKRKFSVTIDPKNTVKEKKEGNNTLSGTIQKGGKYSVQNEEVSSDDNK